MVEYFLDTYALIEILKGNPAYRKYFGARMHTTMLNLYELYVQVLKSYDANTAEKEYNAFKSMLFEINDGHVFSAGKFKLKHRKARISYTDALGYVIAKNEGFRFLTGDKEFKSMENVEFAK